MSSSREEGGENHDKTVTRLSWVRGRSEKRPGAPLMYAATGVYNIHETFIAIGMK